MAGIDMSDALPITPAAAIHMGRNEGVLTTRGRAALLTCGTILAIILGLQSWGILPYRMDDLRERVDSLEKREREGRDLIVALQAQLVAARDEIRLFREEAHRLRSEITNWRVERRELKTP